MKRKDLDNLHVAWRVKFEPGTVKVIARESGKVVAEKEICTAGKPAEIRLTPDRSILTADGKICVLSLWRCWMRKESCPDADNLVNSQYKVMAYRRGRQRKPGIDGTL